MARMHSSGERDRGRAVGIGLLTASLPSTWLERLKVNTGIRAPLKAEPKAQDDTFMGARVAIFLPIHLFFLVLLQLLLLLPPALGTTWRLCTAALWLLSRRRNSPAPATATDSPKKISA